MDTRHEFFMQLADKSDANWELLETPDSTLKSHYVIANFSKVLRTSIHCCSRLSGKQLTQGGLCAFNFAR